jgi:hypothetical protein
MQLPQKKKGQKPNRHKSEIASFVLSSHTALGFLSTLENNHANNQRFIKVMM